VQALTEALQRENFSYTASSGMKSARQAVAEYINKNNDLSVSCDDIILTNGCTTALEICFRALANPGENILIPRPAWNYTTWICGSGIEANFYNLHPDNDWDVDLVHLESLINCKTRAILVNSPGNPCGNVFSRVHILDILKVAERHRLPIISDEVYEFFTFPGVKFHSVASLSKNVPIITCSGLSKRFLMPGIRMGWIVINDRNEILKNVRQGLLNIAGRNFWPNSTTQLALPDILQNTPKTFFDSNVRRVYVSIFRLKKMNALIISHQLIEFHFQNNALSAYEILFDVPGLRPIMPKGAMYMMIGIDLDKFPAFETCFDFAQGLIKEQSVQTFPGYPCFFYPTFFRIVLTVPHDLINEACNRIREFCETHYTLSKKR
jgi:tyrosine aminotransferase